MSQITTHILDTSRGAPAVGVQVMLSRGDGGQWTEIGQGRTDADGRLRTLLPSEHKLSAGRYRLWFDTENYFLGAGVAGFYPEVTVVFEVLNTAQHYHVPLLLNPYGYSTYRGT